MKTAKLLATTLLLALFVGCANMGPPTLAGPSVPDQLKSRGYIVTPADTAPPDTGGMVVDTLR
jgi:hypothetical protein